MIKKGIPASSGYAMGHVYIKREIKITVTDKTVDDPAEEKAKLNQATEKAKEQINVLKHKTAFSMGEDEAMVFDAHLMILEDPEFIGAVDFEIENTGINAMKALELVTSRYISIFNSMENEYMRERSSDINDISARIMRNLAGVNQQTELYGHGTIIAARDLSPSDTASLDTSKVIGFVTETGGKTSHSAIMARTLDIPAVVGVANVLSALKPDDFVIVDGNTGEILINPEESVIREYSVKMAEFQNQKTELAGLKTTRTETLDGKRIEVMGNIGKVGDVDAIIEKGGDGIGLFRTEFLFMDRLSLPGETEQADAYKIVLQKMAGKPVIIRTMDIGGDKRLPYLYLPDEVNPFMGYRAIRICLDRPELFKTQLRALLRASVHGNLKVMFPMISSLGEYQAAMKLVKECMAELDREGIPYQRDIKWGIMIEVPAAAIIADELAKACDFFSIGTNDLIQYSMAADRMSEKVSYLYDPLHPAVLKLIRMTIEAAHAGGIPCGMCGEMAGDVAMIPILLRMGLDAFSMSASSILPAKKKILESWSDLHPAEQPEE